MRQRDPARRRVTLDLRPLLWVDARYIGQHRCADKTAADKLPPRILKEPAMHIGEEQEEFEILPEEEQPVVLPEREPQQHPEAAPA